jgi:hypothetical protein
VTFKGTSAIDAAVFRELERRISETVDEEAGFFSDFLLLLSHGPSDSLLPADLLQDQVLDVDLVPGGQLLNEGAFPQLVIRKLQRLQS